MSKSSSSTQVNVKRMSSSVWEQITTIGIDLGDRFSRWCALDRDGEVACVDPLAVRRLVSRY